MEMERHGLRAGVERRMVRSAGRGRIEVATAILIAAGVSALAGGISARSGNSAARDQRRQIKRASDEAVRQFKFKKIKRNAAKFRKLAASQIQAGVGPEFQQAVDAEIARLGLSGTPRGAALKFAAGAFPAVTAANLGLENTFRRLEGRANARLGAAGIAASVGPRTKANPIIEGLNAGLRTFAVGADTFPGAFSSNLVPTAASSTQVAPTGLGLGASGNYLV